MSEVATAINAAAALRLVAEHRGSDKTAAILREEADRFDEDAVRRERIALGVGGRKRARSLSRVRKATQQRGNAQVCRMAAREIERRKVVTVGQALRPWPLRLICRITLNDQGLTWRERRRVTAHQRESVHPSSPLDNPHIRPENAPVA